MLRALPPRRIAGPGGLEELRRGLEMFVRGMPAPEPGEHLPLTAGGVPAELLVPDRARSDRAILYLHGGGYASGSLASHRGLAVRLAVAARAPVLSVGYRLAPEHPFPAAFDDALAAYRWLRAEDPSRRLAVAGDSAGGGLACALIAALRDAGEPMPVALAAFSPWADLALTGESIDRLAGVDPIFDRESLRSFAVLYYGDRDPRDPRISPLYGDLSGFPPTLIQVGAAEVMLDDSTRLAERLRAGGAPVELDVWPEMIHGWQLFAGMLPEGEEALAQAGAFLDRALAGEAVGAAAALAHAEPGA